MFSKVWVFSLLTWHFMASGMFLEFDARHHAVVNLCKFAHPSLANLTGASNEVAKAKYHYCFSKPGLLFSRFETKSLQQRQLPKNYIQLWDSLLPDAIVYKLVLNGDFVLQKREATKL